MGLYVGKPQVEKSVAPKSPGLPKRKKPRAPMGKPSPPRRQPMRWHRHVPAQQVVLCTATTHIQVLLGDGAVTVTDGYGGWSVQTRDRRRGVTYFAGQPPLSMDVPLMLDGVSTNREMSTTLHVLEAMGTAVGSHGTPLVGIHGPGIPYTDRTWVVNGLAWGDTIFGPTGRRLRLAVTATLLEFVDEQRLVESRPKGKRKVNCATAYSHTARYTVRHGDTLQKIAHRFLGSAACWQRIATLNKIRDPKTLRVGRVLKLPTKKAKKK